MPKQRTIGKIKPFSACEKAISHLKIDSQHLSVMNASNLSPNVVSQTFRLSPNKSIKSAQKGYFYKEKNNWEWYEPPESSLPVDFCRDTSLHGLKYIGQTGRHMCERLFWFSAFTAAVITAMVLIWGLWQTYNANPIITIFKPTEVSLDAIPFPAVTVCNVNNFRKSKVDEYIRKAGQGLNGELPREAMLRTFASLVDIHHICESASTFMERFAGNDSLLNEVDPNIVKAILENKDEYNKFVDPLHTLNEGSQSCSEMILFCVWLDEDHKCSDLFKEIETDFGYCCTFNSIPVSLLMKFHNDERDDPQIVEEWKKANLTTENLMFTSETKQRKYPYRQLYPGRLGGLSFLLDPDLDEFFCSNTDSEGFSIALNIPIDFPKMKDNGVAIRTGSEVFVSVKPEVTSSDEYIKTFDVSTRQCYFGNEWSLPHYTKYTTSNCLKECIAAQTFSECGCFRYYMPGSHRKEYLCSPYDYKCTESVRKRIIKKGLESSCETCLPPCTEIEYLSETTSLPIREDYMDKLFRYHPNMTRNRNLSIVHVYFNVDSVFPKLRRELTSKTELLSNAGGLLGLCMGFSTLSLLELLYYVTIRIACRFYRKKRLSEPSSIKDDPPAYDQETAMTINLTGAAHITKKQRWWWQNASKNAVVTVVSDKEKGQGFKNIEEGSRFLVNPQTTVLSTYYNNSFNIQFTENDYTLMP